MNSNENTGRLMLPLRILYIFLTFIAFVLLLALGLCFVLLKGPSGQAKKLFTLSCNETSAMKWLPGLFLSDEEENMILNPAAEENSQEDGTYHITIVGENMDISFVSNDEEELYPLIDIDSAGEAMASAGITFAENSDVSSDENVPTYELIDLLEPTFKGKVLLVHDPSKVSVASIPQFGGTGWTLSQFVENNDALACINAGGFEDENGKGKGGIPDGVVIRNGEIVYGSAGSSYRGVVGFDANNVLHVGNMTGAQALNEGIVNGMNFSLGPVLIKDGVRQTGFNSGINPRSAIGQAEDGTVILVAIEGRMIDSLGATFEELADIMERFGAVNAANLDGGSSSGMYYEGERVTRSCSVIGDRPLPTAIIVSR